MWAFLSRNRDAGLLMLRISLGVIVICAHGWEKLTGGIEGWRKVGAAMASTGITLWPAFWGFMATMALTLGVLLFIIGFAFRPACLLVAVTLAVAGLHHWTGPKHFIDSLQAASHAWEVGLVFFSLIFVGPGKYSVDKS